MPPTPPTAIRSTRSNRHHASGDRQLHTGRNSFAGSQCGIVVKSRLECGHWQPAHLGQRPARYIEYLPGEWRRCRPTSSTARARAVPLAALQLQHRQRPHTARRCMRFSVGTSVYGSNGNSLPSPPPEFMQELRVNASMYDAQQGATSGAQIDVNTNTGTNNWHGQFYGSIRQQLCSTPRPSSSIRHYQLRHAGNRRLSRVAGQPLASSLDRGNHGGWSPQDEQALLLRRLSAP